MSKSRWNSSKEQWEANEFFRIFTHGKYEEKSYQEKEKQQQPQKKANDVWKKDASDYLPVSTHLYSKQ